MIQLSVCIPVYQISVQKLVRDLWQQSQGLTFSTEIILLDDGSSDSIRKNNRELQALSGVRYHELPQNLGRSAVRNQLTQLAQGQYLLFVDADVYLPELFLQTYAHHFSPYRVVVGGVTIAEKPFDASSILRHKVGQRKESKTANERRASPYQSFLAGNFLIPRSILLDTQFDTSLKGYGHEDTLLGIRLEQNGVPVLHIHNPVVHRTETDTRCYLQQIEESLKNIRTIENQIDVATLSRYFPVWRFRNRIPMWLRRATAVVFPYLKPVIQKQLCTSKPVLLLFDFYKFGYLCTLEHQNHTQVHV